jgi:hypothetical protein
VALVKTTTLPLGGLRITRCSVDYGVTLLLAGEGPQYELRLQTPFTLIEGDRRLLLEPEHTATLGPVVTLFGRNVSSAETLDDGCLSLRLHDALLHITPHPEYEAWTLTGDDGLLVVCGPGGAVTTWSPKRQDSPD